MRHLAIILIIAIFIGCQQNYERTREKTLREKLQKDSLEFCNYVKFEMLEQLERGNLFWFKDFDDFIHAREYLNDSFGIVLLPIFEIYHCATGLLDTIITKKYGEGFYEIVEKQISDKYRGIPEHLTIDKYYTYAEKFPEYPGDIDSLQSYLFRKVPDISRCNIDLKYGGRMLVSFVIQTDGSLQKAKVVEKLCPEIDSIVVNLLYHLPNTWSPAVHENIKVPFLMTLYLEFKNREKNNN
jgi:hypothetical protein